MHRAETDKLDIFKSRNHPENAALFRPGQLGLKADQVVHGFLPVFGAQLNDGMRLMAGIRIDQTDRFHRPEAKRFHAARSQLFDRHAPFEVDNLLKVTRRNLLAAHQFIDKAEVFILIERTVEIVIAIPLAVARGGKDLGHIERIGGNDRGNGVIEVEPVTGQLRQ